MNKQTITASCFSALLALALPTIASAAHDESVNGDLSSNFASPTALSVVSNGRTSVKGSIEGAGNHVTSDTDYFTFSVPVGQTFSGFHVLPGTVGSGTGSFIGLFAGSAALDPTTPPPVLGPQTLGYYLYGASDVGTDILADLGTFSFGGFDPQGFTPPLPAGDYTFWMQEGDLGTFSYNFEIELTAVPEPTTAGLLMANAAFARRRRVG